MGKNVILVPYHSSGYCTSSPGCCKAYEGCWETKKTQGKFCELDLQNKYIQSDKRA